MQRAQVVLLRDDEFLRLRPVPSRGALGGPGLHGAVALVRRACQPAGLAPVKERRTLIGASRKMIVYDDMEQSDKINVYEKGITVNQQLNREKH